MGNAGLLEKIRRLKSGIQTGRITKRKTILRALNSIDRSLQVILAKAENKIKPKQGETVSDELRRVKSERKYWIMLLHNRKRISHVGLEKIWTVHRENNVALSRENKKAELKRADKKGSGPL